MMQRFDPESAPKGVFVLVAGGIAMKKTGGQWFSGMDSPMDHRPLSWEPNWWAPIPDDNSPLPHHELRSALETFLHVEESDLTGAEWKKAITDAKVKARKALEKDEATQ